MKLFTISLVTFILVAASTFIVGGKYTDKYSNSFEANGPVVEKKPFENAPILKGDSELPVISAYSVYAMDVDSGLTLIDKNSDSPTLPASTTKIITALTALDYYSLDEKIRVGNVRIDGQKMDLVAGEEISVKSLLEGLLIYSANDAAEVLADNYPGGRENFISAMNLKAKELGLNNSHFTNPTGLDSPGHESTAKDLVYASYNAMKIPFFSDTVAKKQISVESSDGKIVHKLKNINELLGKVDGVLGIKTGWTENAKENLVTYVERKNRKVLIALLGSSDRFGETEKLISWIFENYEWDKASSSSYQFSAFP